MKEKPYHIAAGIIFIACISLKIICKQIHKDFSGYPANTFSIDDLKEEKVLPKAIIS